MCLQGKERKDSFLQWEGILSIVLEGSGEETNITQDIIIKVQDAVNTAECNPNNWNLKPNIFIES